MFACAIYDGRRRELFAARDRLGKPFFYNVMDGALHFSSCALRRRQLSLQWSRGVAHAVKVSA